MDFSPDAKRAFHVQTYGAATAIDGVRVVELTRHADDSGAMTELARLTDGRAAGLGDFSVRQVNYSEMAPGGAGFIGSNFIRHLLREHPDDSVVNLDKLTYAGNPANLADVAGDPRYAFVQGDICDAKLVRDVARGVDAIVNLAAESHVDRSLVEPDGFLRTDVFGVFTLLEAVRDLGIPRLLHVSTDEV